MYSSWATTASCFQPQKDTLTQRLNLLQYFFWFRVLKIHNPMHKNGILAMTWGKDLNRWCGFFLKYPISQAPLPDNQYLLPRTYHIIVIPHTKNFWEVLFCLVVCTFLHPRHPLLLLQLYSNFQSPVIQVSVSFIFLIKKIYASIDTCAPIQTYMYSSK